MNKTTKKKAIGRPTKYRKEMCETMLDLFKGGATVAEVCVELDIHRDTFYQWVKEKPEFSDTYKKGKELAEKWWAKIGQAGMLGKLEQPINSAMWIFNMKARFKWQDRHEVEVINETPQRIEIKLVDELGEDE